MKKGLLKVQKYIYSTIVVGLICLFSIVASPSSASASSSLSLSPDMGTYTIGNTFSVTIKINSNGKAINAVEAYLTFDKNKFQITSIDTSQSIFLAWPKLEYSNTAGTIHFAGGLSSPGFTGAAGAILVINFKGTALGTGNVTFDGWSNSPSVLLSDGLGTEDYGNSTGGSYTIIPAALSAACSASPSSANVNGQITFNAYAGGESGVYTYSWSGECTGVSSSCSKTFTSVGPKTTSVTVSSNGKSTTASCSANIGLPGPSVTCSSPEFVEVDKPITFLATAAGGSGAYTYSWSNSCLGNTASCTNSISTPGIKTATVSATSAGKSSSANCIFYVGNSCLPTQGNGGGVVATNESYSPSLCPEYLTSYIKPGEDNDVDQVKKLQTFLNTYNNASLVVDGVYKTADINAVKSFQVQNKETVLDFWNTAEPSGNVYISTQKAINRVYCEKTKGLECPYFLAPSNAENKTTPGEIAKIRKFLVNTQNENISITSTDFNSELISAINSFQLKYTKNVLTPWNIDKPTGLWYQSTRKYADELVGCYYPVRLDNGVVLP